MDMDKWAPNLKVAGATVLGPIIAAVIAGLATDPFDWKLPLVALLTGAIAYLVPEKRLTNGKHST